MASSSLASAIWHSASAWVTPPATISAAMNKVRMVFIATYLFGNWGSSLRRAGQLTDRVDDLHRLVGLGDKPGVRRKITGSYFDVARGCNDPDWGPAVPDSRRQFRTVH